MTQEQLYAEYLAWLDGDAPLERGQLFRLPLANRDVEEDGASLVNRLYFAVPRFVGAAIRLFVFFEENHFVKDAAGDLALSHSAFFVPKG